MNWEAIKHIYIKVLKHGCKIQYHGDDCYTITQHYPNGNKHWEAEWENGKPHGKYIEWWENGNKRWENEYQNGQRHGKHILWHENGNKHWEYEYRNGELI